MMASPWWCKALTRRVSTYRRTPTRRCRQRNFRPFVELLEDRRLMAVFTVTTTAATGAGSLAWAIQQANSNLNSNVEADTIRFRIAEGDEGYNTATNVATIEISSSALLAITDAKLHIDGADAEDAGGARQFIVVNGVNAGDDANGIEVKSADNTITGLVIQQFDGHGVYINGPGAGLSGADGNLIEGCFIGTDDTGAFTGFGNGGNGVYIRGSSHNIVGGAAPPSLDAGAGNLISGNAGHGVLIERADFSCTPTGVSNLVSGNYIGVDATGEFELGNNDIGVALINSISTAVSNNVISANGVNGVYIAGGSGSAVSANKIGTDVTGLAGLGNHNDGVHIETAVGVAVSANLISANAHHGVFIQSGSGHAIGANTIGLDSTGLGWLGNGYGYDTGEGPSEPGGDGVHISDSTGNTVDANFISANYDAGVRIRGEGSFGNKLFNNIIGLGSDGATASSIIDSEPTSLGNDQGVVIESGAHDNTVGSAGVANTISNNFGAGVRIHNAHYNLVGGNRIGVDITSRLGRGNAVGVEIIFGGNNSVGRTADGKGGGSNIISANAGSGVSIEGTPKDSGLTGNLVAGNWIGTNGDSDDLGNGADGVHVIESDGNTVGGASSTLGNTIRWNSRGGVWLQAASDNTVENNTISNNGAAVATATYTVPLPVAAAFFGFTGGTGAADYFQAGYQSFWNFTVNGALNTIELSENSATGGGYDVYSASEFYLTDFDTNLANSVFRPYAGSLTDFSVSFDVYLSSYSSDDLGFTFAIAGAGDALGLGGLGYLGYAATDSIAVGFQASGTLGLYQNGELVEGSEVALANSFGNAVSHIDISYANGQLTVQVAVSDSYYGPGGYGVLISNSIGEGSGPADRNIVAANAVTDNYGDGVRIENDDYYGSGPTENLVAGNTISGNQGDGVEIFDSEYNYVRDGNQITDNAGSGVLIEGYYGFARGNEVTGNVISRNFEGITVYYADENVIGQTGAGNTVSANYGDGVFINGDSNSIIGNTISTNEDDGLFIAGDFNVAQANTVTGNGGDGVALGSSATSNLIGGSSALGQGNTITGNSGNGVIIGDGEVSGAETANLVQGNYIGSNVLNGVLIRDGQSYNLIGQFAKFPNGDPIPNAADYGNVIANNGLAGVAVAGARYDFYSGEGIYLDHFTTKNAIVGNLITGWGTLPIDLYEVDPEPDYDDDLEGAPGPTANDEGDPDDGPNQLQNYPTLDPGVVSGSIVSYTTHFDSPGKEGDFYFEFYGYTSSGGVVFLGGFYTLPETFTLDQSLYPTVTQIGVTATRLAYYFGEGQGPSRITPFAETPRGGLQVGSTSEMFLIAVPQPDVPDDDPPDVNVVNTLEEEPASERTVTDSSVIVPPQDAATLASINSLSLRRAQELQELNRFFSQEPLADSPGEIHGRLFDDVNAVGQKADGTLPLAGYQVYIDLNGNGELDEGEPITATNDKGEYSFTGLRPGQYIVRPVLGRNDDQTFGSREDNRVELRSGVMVINNVDFGVRIRGRRAAPRRSGMLPGMEHHGLLASPDELARYWSDETPAVAAAPTAAPLAELPPEVVAAPVESPSWWTWLTLGAGVLIGPWFHVFRKRKRRKDEAV